jgi:hypothetical protein
VTLEGCSTAELIDILVVHGSNVVCSGGIVAVCRPGVLGKDRQCGGNGLWLQFYSFNILSALSKGHVEVGLQNQKKELKTRKFSVQVSGGRIAGSLRCSLLGPSKMKTLARSRVKKKKQTGKWRCTGTASSYSTWLAVETLS